MGLNHAGAGLILAALTALPAQAQTAHSPGASPPRMTSAGLPVPLRGEETLVPLGDGCAVVSPTPPTPQAIESMAKYRWYGGCRFGLAHGKGILHHAHAQYPFSQEKHYRFGIDAATGMVISDSKRGDQWVRREHETFWAFGRTESLTFSNWTLPANAGEKYRSLSFRRSRDPETWSHYFQLTYFCSLEERSPDKLQAFPDAEDRMRVEQACREGSRSVEYIQHKRAERLGNGAKYPDGRHERILAVRHHLCRSKDDCRDAWTAATAEEWPEIERLKAELPAAHQAFMAEWEARFAPLQAAFEAKIARLSRGSGRDPGGQGK